MRVIAKFIYDLFIRCYTSGIRLAAPFNNKASKWVDGRKNWRVNLKKDLPEKGVDLWIHCASLGEFEQGRPVIEGLREKHPDIFILLSFFSPSGYEIRKNYKEANAVCYLPADTAKNAESFIS